MKTQKKGGRLFLGLGEGGSALKERKKGEFT